MKNIFKGKTKSGKDFQIEIHEEKTQFFNEVLISVIADGKYIESFAIDIDARLMFKKRKGITDATM